jgi:4-amino-4-deoxy-L-arabinose transferase-like glycosyltransferase
MDTTDEALEPEVPHGGTMAGGVGPIWRIACVFGIALLVRLIVMFETADVPTVRHLIGDAAGYMAWAVRLADGAWIGEASFYQAPLYPYILGVLFKFFGSSVFVVRFAHCVWGACGCALMAVAGGRLFGHRVGWVSGLMMALYMPAVYYDGVIQKASVSLFLCAGVVAGIVVYQRGQRRGALFVLGATVGLLCLTRENALLWLVVIGAWVFVKNNLRGVVGRMSDGATYGTGALMILAPALVHNVYVSGSWSLTTSQSGPNFFIGNSVEADGRYRPLVRGHETPVCERTDAARLASQDEGRALSPREVSSYWMRRAWDDIARDPVRWLGLCGRKMVMTINAYEVADGDSWYVHARSSVLLRWLGSVWHFGLLFPLGVFGMVSAWRSRHSVGIYVALLVTMILGVSAFFVLGRYRLPLVPVLVPFAAFGVVALADQIRSRRFQVGMGGAILSVVALVVSNWGIHDERRLDALAAMNAGVALAQVGDVGAGQKLFAAAVAVHPDSAEANLNLALSLAVQERFKEAIPYYRQALRIAPAMPGLHFNLAVALERTGDAAAALAQYERALLQDATDTDAQRSVVRLRGSS